MNKYDSNSDGTVSDDEIKIAELEFEEERRRLRQRHQKKIAWVAMWSMIVFTVMLFMPFFSDDRISLIVEISALFYLAQAGIVSAFMGASAYMENVVDRDLDSPTSRTRRTR